MITGLSGAGAGAASGFATESAANATGDAAMPLAAGGADAGSAAACEAATAKPVTLGSVSRWAACAAGEFPLLVPDDASFALGFCEAALCELACDALTPCVPAALEFGRWIAEAVTGVTIFGKADAADSVPGPALEKNTENGVCPAIGSVVAESDPAAAVKVEPGALWRPVAARTVVLLGAVGNCGAANGSGALLASICAARFKTAALEVCASGVDALGIGAATFPAIGKLAVPLPSVPSFEAFDPPG